jgi:hypothetical protein
MLPTAEVFAGEESSAHLLRCRLDEVYESPPSPCVYIVRGVSGGPVKIGRAKSAIGRLGELQVSNPDLLEIVVAIRASNISEIQTHWAFSHLRLRGEWFRLGPDLLTFIRRVSAWHGPGYERMFGGLTCSCAGACPQ